MKYGEFVKAVCRREGKKSEVEVGNMREAIKSIAEEVNSSSESAIFFAEYCCHVGELAKKRRAAKRARKAKKR